MSHPTYTGYNFVDTLHHDIYSAIDPTKTDLSQPSKVVLITGPGRGIGRSIALRYAESGVASLILCSRTAPELDDVETAIKKINPRIRVHKFATDVSDESQVVKVVEAVTGTEGRLDILINNAGTGDPWKPLTDTVVDDYWRTITVNLKGPYLLMKAFLPLMIATAGEAESATVDIVNISSIGATMVVPGASSYQVSKLALTRLSQFVQLEFGSKGVNCVAVHPGGVLTDLSKNIPERFKASLVDTPDLCGGFVVWLTHGERGGNNDDERKTNWLGGRYVSANWDVDELAKKKADVIEEDKLRFRMVI